MKKLFNNIKQFIENPSKTTTSQAETFFKNVNCSQAKNGYQAEVLNRINALDRIIVEGKQKNFVMSRIQENVTRSKLGNHIGKKMQDACEIVHYGLINDTPILISHVQLLFPDFDLTNLRIINEQDYERWLRDKSSLDQGYNKEDKNEVLIEDDLNSQETGGKSSQDDWEYSKNQQDWRKKNKK